MRPATVEESGAIRGAALRAAADAAGVPIHHQVRTVAMQLIQAGQRAESDSLPGRTWRAIAIEARVVVVMLAATAPGDARELARQPWDSFSAADQASMAACARLLARELRQAGSLF